MLEKKRKIRKEKKNKKTIFSYYQGHIIHFSYSYCRPPHQKKLKAPSVMIYSC